MTNEQQLPEDPASNANEQQLPEDPASNANEQQLPEDPAGNAGTTPPTDPPPAEAPAGGTTATPSQTFAEQMRSLRAALQAGDISIETFREHQQDAQRQFAESRPKPFGWRPPEEPRTAEPTE